jgi:dTDP-4-dehydrorhamnose reductase
VSAGAVLLTGAGGQLATDLRRVLSGREVAAFAHTELDVCDSARVGEAVAAARPRVVINTAAFHRVDDCETEGERAFAVNALGVLNLALACKEHGAALLHLSTDYVFDGEKDSPYLEDDTPKPVSMYGVSKLAGELIIRYTLERHYVVRSSGLYGVAGASGKGGNFVNTMLRLAREGKDINVVDDQRLTPTYTLDLARKMAWLIDQEAFGVWHITSAGDCSWYEFAGEIFRQSGLSPKLAPTTSEAFGARARRPAYSVLGHGRLRERGADDMRPWQDALADYLSALGAAAPSK